MSPKAQHKENETYYGIKVTSPNGNIAYYGKFQENFIDRDITACPKKEINGVLLHYMTLLSNRIEKYGYKSLSACQRDLPECITYCVNTGDVAEIVKLDTSLEERHVTKDEILDEFCARFKNTTFIKIVDNGPDFDPKLDNFKVIEVSLVKGAQGLCDFWKKYPFFISDGYLKEADENSFYDGISYINENDQKEYLYSNNQAEFSSKNPNTKTHFLTMTLYNKQWGKDINDTIPIVLNVTDEELETIRKYIPSYTKKDKKELLDLKSNYPELYKIIGKVWREKAFSATILYFNVF